MKNTRKIVVLLLAACLLFNLFSYVSAETFSENAAQPEEVVRVGEVESLRETNSETYLMSDGTYECVVYAENKYYRNANDVLLPIDNAIVAASGGANLLSTQYTNTANAFDVTFSGSGTPEVSISYGDAGITFIPVNATGSGNMHMTASASAIAIGTVQDCPTLSQLTATGSNTATYANAFGSADLVYVLENDALKEYIILEDSAAPNSFNFLFTLDGVTLQETDSGAAFLNAAGEVVFLLGSLFAVDANGVPTDDLTYTFQTVKNNIVGVTVTLDPEYLAAADRAFPVVIDPTVTVVVSSSSTADACVCEKYPTTNYYMAAQLRTGYDTDYGKRRSYIRFSIPDSIGVGSVISAYLDVEKLSGVAPTMRAYRVTGSWSSSTITWNNKPGYTTTHQSTQSAQLSSGSSWYRMDVTSIVNGWINGAYLNYGFALVDSIENDSNHWTTLYSSDADSPHKPELYITYTDSSSGGEGGGTTEERYNFYVDHYLDLGYRIRFPSNATNRVRAHQAVVSDLLSELFNIDTITTYTSFQSYMDDCKHLSSESVLQSNLYIPCTHSPTHYTSRALHDDFVNMYGNGTIQKSRVIWTGHILQNNARSTSWAASYSVIITPYAYVDEDNNYATESDTKVNTESRFDLMHELSHQLGLIDHYCGKDSGTTCTNENCWKCNGWPNPYCIMDQRMNIETTSINSLYCSSCISRMNSHLDDHH